MPGAETSPCVEGECLGELKCLSNVCVDPGDVTTESDPTNHPTTTTTGTSEATTTAPGTAATSDETVGVDTTEGTTTTTTTTTTEGTTTTTTTTEGTTTNDSTSTTGGPPVCGDGVVQGGEGCDDGNNFDGDGCSGGCTPEPIKYMVVGGSPPFPVTFWVVNLLNNYSIQLVSKQALGDTLLTPAVSNQHVYIQSDDAGGLHRYNLYTGEWTSYAADPPALKNTAGFMEWVGNGVCLGYWTVKELHCHDGVSWRKIALTISPDRVAVWDPVANQIYIKVYKQWGFQVVDLDTDTIVGTVAGAVNNSTQIFAAYSSGFFYTSDGTNVYRIHAQNGALQNLMISLPGLHHAGDFHPETKTLFIITDNNQNTYHTLTQYDPLSGVSNVLSSTLQINPMLWPVLRFQRPAGE